MRYAILHLNFVKWRLSTLTVKNTETMCFLQWCIRMHYCGVIFIISYSSITTTDYRKQYAIFSPGLTLVWPHNKVSIIMYLEVYKGQPREVKPTISRLQLKDWSTLTEVVLVGHIVTRFCRRLQAFATWLMKWALFQLSETIYINVLPYTRTLDAVSSGYRQKIAFKTWSQVISSI